jgi:peroxiredoxin
MTAHDPNVLPADLPAPEDDGAARHLAGMAVPPIAPPATDGSSVRLDTFGAAPPARRGVVFAYPRTGVPGEDPLVPGWDAIPGARGCTPESCGFRDLHAEIAAAGAAVTGLSVQPTEYQREAVERLRLPYPMLSDADRELTRALRLPTFGAAGVTLLRRLTLVIHDGTIEHVFYPVFPPDGHAAEVLAWLRARR